MTCTRSSRSSRIGRTLVLAAALWLAAAPAAALAAEGAEGAPGTPAHEGLGVIRGVLFKEDEVTRLAGATVAAINVRTGRRYVSNHTGDNGAYQIDDLPAGTYDIAIDADGRLYVTDSLVDLAENQRLYLSFAIIASAAASPASPDFKGGAKLTFTDPSAVPQASSKQKKSFWKRPGGIAIISVLVAGAAAAAVSAQQSD